MSTFGYKNIKDAIVTILGTVSSVEAVYGKEEKKLVQFPAACVSAKQHTAELHDTVSNRKHYEHYVRVYFRTDETNDADYEDVLESVADDVIAALEHDITLGGAVQWSIPTSGVWKADLNTKETPVRLIEIVVRSEARVVR